MGGISLAISMLALLLITDKKSTNSEQSSDQAEEKVLTLSQVLRSKDTYLFYFMVSFNLISLNTFNVNYKV